jgi:ABC-type sugar transport system permease subunit
MRGDGFVKSSATRRNRITAYCFLLPNLAGFVVFTLIPVVAALGLSFMRWDSYNPTQFVGLQNFQTMTRDSSFRISFWNTLYFTFATVPLTVVASLILALALDKGVKGLEIFRAIHFFPHIASTVAVAVVWQFLYNADMGPINMLLRTIGVMDPPRWTASVTWAMPAVILMSVWKSAGYHMIMFLAGLQGIPNHLYEAAIIDGCSRFKAFWTIVLPNTKPALSTFAIIGFNAGWNSFLWPLIVINDVKKMTIQVGLSYFRGVVSSNWGVLLAGTTMAIVPVMIVFLIFQKYFVEGMVTSGFGGK